MRGDSLVTSSDGEFGEGVELEVVQERYKEAVGEGDKGFKTGLEGRKTG
jgi:hypothetical protein